jgi:hypothetical protein
MAEKELKDKKCRNVSEEKDILLVYRGSLSDIVVSLTASAVLVSTCAV